MGRWASCLVLLALASCEGSPVVQQDAQLDANANDLGLASDAGDDGGDASPFDADTIDAAQTDADFPDATGVDASPFDADTIDAAQTDADFPDATGVDASAVDADTIDAAPGDADGTDATSVDASAVDTTVPIDVAAACAALQQLAIAPTSPTTDEPLVATVQFSELAAYAYLRVSWTADGAPTTEDALVVPAARTSRDQRWEITAALVHPDGGCSATAAVTVVDSAPSCGAAMLAPAPLFASEPATCACGGYSDADGDPAAAPTCTWTDAAGRTVGVDCVLPASVVRNGAPITCTITTTDGTLTGAPASVTVDPSNAQPSLTSVTLTSDVVPVRGIDLATRLTCAAVAADLEGDAMTNAVSWTVNGTVVHAEVTTQTGLTATVGELTGWLGRALVRDDRVGCDVSVSDGVSIQQPAMLSAAPLSVGNTPPVVTAVALADVRGNELMSCEPTFVDADGDVPILDATYTWRSTALGVLPSTGRTQSTVGLARGDTVTCDVRVSDGFDVAGGTSNAATVLNRLPTATGLFLGPDPLPATVDRSVDYAMLYCQGGGFRDDDGDPEAYLCEIFIDDVLVRSGMYSGNSGINIDYSQATWDVGQTIRVRATPWDGLEFGPAVEQLQEVAIGQPTPCANVQVTPSSPTGSEDLTCACAQFYPSNDGDPSDDRCRWWIAGDRNVTSLSGTTFGQPVTSPLLVGCTIPAALLTPGVDLVCAYAAYDHRTAPGGQRYSDERTSAVVAIGPTAAPPSFVGGNVRLSPAPDASVTFKDDYRCDWDPVGVVSTGIAPRYQVDWRVNGVQLTPYREIPGPPSSVSNVFYSQEGLISAPWLFQYAWGAEATPFVRNAQPAPGDLVECGVRVYDGRQFTAWSWSPVTTVRAALPGELLALPITPSDGAVPLDDVRCAMEVEPGFSGTFTLELRGSDDGVTWTTLDSTSTTTSTSLSLTQAATETTPRQLACRALRDGGTGPIVLGTSDVIRVFRDPPTLQGIAVSPSSGDACVPRACVFDVVEPATGPLRGFTYDVSVQWSVSGVPDGNPVTLVVAGDRSRTSLDVPAPPLRAGLADTLTCSVRVTKRGLTAPTVGTSAPGTLTGTPPSVTSVTLPPFVRSDGIVTCAVQGVGTTCVSAPTILTTWTLDGVVVGQGTTLDASGLRAGGTLSCTATPVTAGGLAGTAQSSGPAELLPGRWTMYGNRTSSYSGMSVDSLPDITGDGLPEILVGAPNASFGPDTSAGELFMVRGSWAGGVSSLLDVEAGTGGKAWRGDSGGWTMLASWCNDPANTLCQPTDAGVSDSGAYTAPLGDGLGTRVRATGDTDGDGVPDLLVSAPYALAHGEYLTGRTYQISGASLLRPNYSIGQLERDGGRLLDGAAGVDHLKTYRQTSSTTWVLDPHYDGHLAGFALATPDLDGDGFGDPVVGAPNAEGDLETGAGIASNAGGTWVVPGGPGRGDVWLGDVPDTAQGGLWIGVDLDRSAHPWAPVSSQLGRHLANVGDMDGDGDDELLVGHTGAFGFDGGWWNTTYVVLGGELTGGHLRDPSARVRRVAAPGASFGQSWSVPDAVYSGKTDWFGMASGAGDVNGDGLADLVVPFTEREGGVAQAEVAVFFGTPTSGDFDVEGPDRGIGGFVVEGRPREGRYSMLITAGLGDVDGDGLDDIGIAYQAAGPGGPTATKLAIVYGRTGTTSLTWADLESGLAGTVIDLGGSDVPTELVGADVDGDGLSDAIIGRPYYGDAGRGTNSGRVDVWYGRDLRGKVHSYGTRGADVLSVFAPSGSIVGGPGDDRLATPSANSVMMGGSGDDWIYAEANVLRARGGSGTDTLALPGSPLPYDLRAMRGHVEGFEILDLTIGSTVVTIGVADVLRLPDLNRTLTVRGDGAATVVLPDAGWLADVDSPAGRRVFRNGAATLEIDRGVHLQIAPQVDVGTLAVDEGSPLGTLVTTVTATDYGGGLVDLTVTTDPRLAFDRVTGALTVAVDGLDHETTPRLSLHIRAVGPTGLVVDRTEDVLVRDVAEPPVFVGRTARITLPEYAANGTTVALLAAVDQDVGDTVTFAWVSEDHAGRAGHAFEIEPTTGRVYVADGSWLDFETAPIVTAVFEARDPGGLTARRTITVDLLDRQTVTQLINVPFFSEDMLLVDPNDTAASLVLGGFQDTEDVTTAPQDATIEATDLTAGDQVSFATTLTGSVARGISLTVTPPRASVYMPIQVSALFPDNVVLGQAFTPTTNWALQDDAVLYGNTTGLDLALQLNLYNLGMEIFAQTPSAVEKVDPIYANGTFHLGIEPEALAGAKMSILDPDGFTRDGSTFETDCLVTVDMCPNLPPSRYPVAGSGLNSADFSEADWARYCPSIPYVPSMRRCDVLDPEAIANLGYNALFKDRVAVGERFYGDDVIVSPGMTNRMLRVPTDPLLILANLGLPQITKLWGAVTVPVPGLGYHRLDYAIYKAPNIVVVDSHEMFAAMADGLVGTLTFEGGTAVTAELRTGFGGIVLPTTEDVNGDGRLTFTFDLRLEATMHRVWLWNLSLLWPTKVLGVDVRSVIYERDLLGNVIGERLVADDHWGPLYESRWLIDVGAKRSTASWPAQGFEVISFDGAIQLTRP